MAVVQTDFTPALNYVPYTGLSALQRSQSAIARAELQYFAVNESWPSPGGANNRLLKTQITLPSGYGYVVTDCYADVTNGSDHPDVEALAQLQLQPAGVLGPNIIVPVPSQPSRQDTSGTTPIGDIPARFYNATYPSWRGDYGSVTFSLENKPSLVLYDYKDGSSASLISFTIAESVNGQPTYDVQFYLRVLQYDVDQSYNYVLNTPQLTR